MGNPPVGESRAAAADPPPRTMAQDYMEYRANLVALAKERRAIHEKYGFRPSKYLENLPYGLGPKPSSSQRLPQQEGAAESGAGPSKRDSDDGDEEEKIGKVSQNKKKKKKFAIGKGEKDKKV